MNRTIGIVLIIIGAVMLIWTGFTYTKKEKVMDQAEYLWGKIKSVCFVEE